MAAPVVSSVPHDARPVASKAPVKLPVVTNPNRPASKVVKSADPAYDAAVAQAQAALTAEQQPILSQQASSDAYYKQRGTDATANATALAELLKGIGPAEQNTYDTAAQNDSLLANGFSHGMQDAIQGNTENLNAMLSKLGSPATLDSHAASTGDVLQGLGGYIPGKSLTREGAGFAAAANMLPATALLQGAENVKAISASGDAAHAGFDNKIAELAAKLPGDVQTNYMNLQKLALDSKKFALQVQKNQFDQAYKTASIKLQQAKYQTGIAEFNARQSVSVARLNLDAQKFARQTLQSDRTYGIQLQKLGISQRADQRAALAAEYKLQNGGYSQTQMLKFNTELQKRINAIVTGAGPDGKPTYSVHKGGDANAPLIPITFGDFVKYAVAQGVPPSLALDRAKQFFDPSAIPPGAGLHLPLGQTGNGNVLAFPQPGLKFARVDQGVDFVASAPVAAFAPGRVVSITGGMAGGTGHIIKVRLDTPVTVNGNTYYGIYYSEQTPLVRVGQRVRAGKPVMAAGGNELGFLDQNMQMPALVGGLGAGTQPTVGGQDFLAWVGGK